MYFLIDGYNFLFSFETSSKLQKQRQNLVRILQIEFSKLNLEATIVFDGKHVRDEESGLSYPSPLIIAYSPKGQTADEYILEHIEFNKKPHLITVVTNDKALCMHAKSLGAHCISNMEFIHKIQAKAQRKKVLKEKEIKDSPQNIERLLKIFEDKLNEK